MSFIHSLKQIIKQNQFALYLIEKRKKRKYENDAIKYNDYTFICKLYKKANNGELPDLDNPTKFTEKLQWLKLYYRDSRIPICSDKFEAKKYVAEHGYPELIIPNIAVYDKAEDIDISALPDSFIIKATHGSGWNIICNGNKNQINWTREKKIMSTWLKQNLYIYGREWNYKEQTPRLIVEELLDSNNIVDYKFMCFNGNVKAMQVNHEIDGKSFVDFYDDNWNLLKDMSCGVYPNSNNTIDKPADFDKMKNIAEELASPFPFVRVDLYYVNGNIYFGEMTFFPGSGFWSITPTEMNERFGDWLMLPCKNN